MRSALWGEPQLDADSARAIADDGWDFGALGGMMVGGALGASFGASAPKLRGKCTFGARILRSTAGSFFGGLFGNMIGLNVGDGDAVSVAMPVGSVLGASTALLGC